MSFIKSLRKPNSYGREQSADIAVAGILDTFSSAAFSKCFDYFPIGRSDYALFLEAVKPRFLLVESAWNGNEGDWCYQLTSPTGPKIDFLGLIKSARQQNIPVVFWNKEDPPHFEQFLPVASQADHILTTEAALISEYQQRTGISSVHRMRFAAETSIHRPDQVDGYRQGDVCFAGQYFQHKFPQRRQQMDTLFSAAKNFDFSIFSRALGADKEYQFPKNYEKFIAGSLPYDEMLEEYRRHKIFLNVNSVPHSKSMCARRIFELAAAKSLVMSLPTEAISSVYSDDEVLLVNNTSEATEVLRHYLNNQHDYLSATQRAWRTTLSSHTYRHRAVQILDFLEISHPPVYSPVDVVIENIAAIEDIPGALARSGILPTIKAGHQLGLVNSVRLASTTECPDLLTEFSGEPCDDLQVVQMDLMCSYGPNYLLDLVLLGNQFCEADAVTKAALQAPDRINTSNYWGLAKDIVHGGTLFANQNSYEKAKMRDKDLKVFVGDDFNFAPNADLASYLREN